MDEYNCESCYDTGVVSGMERTYECSCVAAERLRRGLNPATGEPQSTPGDDSDLGRVTLVVGAVVFSSTILYWSCA